MDWRHSYELVDLVRQDAWRISKYIVLFLSDFPTGDAFNIWTIDSKKSVIYPKSVIKWIAKTLQLATCFTTQTQGHTSSPPTQLLLCIGDLCWGLLSTTVHFFGVDVFEPSEKIHGVWKRFSLKRLEQKKNAFLPFVIKCFKCKMVSNMSYHHRRRSDLKSGGLENFGSRLRRNDLHIIATQAFYKALRTPPCESYCR